MSALSVLVRCGLAVTLLAASILGLSARSGPGPVPASEATATASAPPPGPEAGTATPAPSASPTAAAPGPRPTPANQSRPADPAAPRPVLAQPRFAIPVVLGQASTAEPAVHAAADGGVLVDYLGGSGAATVWRSADGAHFAQLDTSALRGGGDEAVAVAPDGTLHYVGLQPGAAAQAGQPTLPFQSAAPGQPWSEPFDVAGGAAADRPWLAESPGQTLVAWKAGSDLDLRRLAGGAWQDTQRVAGNVELAGPLATGAGLVVLPFTSASGFNVSLAASADGGRTWTLHAVAALDRVTSPAFKTTLFPVAGIDRAGTIYVVWSATQPGSAIPGVAPPKPLARQGVYLAASRDGGASWSPPRLLSPPDRSAIFPWLGAGAPGRVAVSWYENRMGSADAAPDLWDVTLVESVTADGPAPVFAGGHLNAQPVHVGQICDLGVACTAGDRSRGDFFANAIRSDGQPVVAWVQDAAAPGQAEVAVGWVAEGTPLA